MAAAAGGEANPAPSLTHAFDHYAAAGCVDITADVTDEGDDVKLVLQLIVYM